MSTGSAAAALQSMGLPPDVRVISADAPDEHEHVYILTGGPGEVWQVVVTRGELVGE